MAESMWKKLDAVEHPPFYLSANDDCFYARDYKVRARFDASEANQLISNLKIPITCSGQPRWRYKQRAIQQFAQELSTIFDDLEGHFAVAPIPPSKREDHPEYDSRIVDVVQALANRCPNVLAVRPIVRGTSCQPAHHQTSRPSPQQLYSTLEWVGYDHTVSEHLVFIDDVVTTGNSFKQCEKLVLEHHADIQVHGVFWARAVWPECIDEADN